MARRGRPGKGAELVSDTDGSEQARQRLKVILQTLTGALPVAQACNALGIGRSAFHKLRQQFLSRATELLEPRPRGRQVRVLSAADHELARLKREIVRLKLDLKAQQIREEIALVMPHLLRGGAKRAHKKTRRSSPRSARARSDK